MNGRLTRFIAFAAAALLTALPARVQAQENSRFRVLVPDFFALEGSRRNFGRDVAEELRKQLEALPTHEPIAKKEIENQLKQFDLKMEDLDCLKTRQVATQINSNLALCASFTEQGETRQLSGIEFWDMATGEPLAVADVTVTGKDAKIEAAQHIFAAFDRMVDLARAQQFCADYANSQQWDNAMPNCDKALALNPRAVGTRMRKARILFEQARSEETPESAKRNFFQGAMDEIKTVLSQNEFHEEALQLAGYVAIQLDDPETGRDYYRKYLKVNPGADQVRLTIAFEMAQAGDPEGAMQFIKVGLDAAPDNADLLEYYAGYGVSAANKRAEAAQGDANAGLTPEAQALYREVVSALNKALAIRGDEMNVGYLRTLVVSHLALGDAVTAEAVARKALALHPDEALIWAQLADALQRQGKIDEAVQALTKVEQIQPDFPSLQVRQGNWLLTAGRMDDALPYFRKAAEKGTDPNTVSRVIYSDAANNGIRRENWSYAMRGITAAKSFKVNAETRAELDFWHGWAIYHQAMAAEKPQTFETSTQTKPMFEQAKTLFSAGRSFASKAGVNLQQIMDAVDTYIEIETVLIRRGGD